MIFVPGGRNPRSKLGMRESMGRDFFSRGGGGGGGVASISSLCEGVEVETNFCLM